MFFHSNGKEESKGSFIEGSRSGEWTFYDDQGAIKSRGLFENNRENGPFVFFHSNGKEESKGLHKNGLKIGIWKHFNPQGKFIFNTKYINR